MESGGKSKRYYENLVYDKSPMAAAIGRRPPYHLTYIREHSASIPLPGKAVCTREEDDKKP